MLWEVFLGMYISVWENSIILLFVVEVFVKLCWDFMFGFEIGEKEMFVILDVF